MSLEPHVQALLFSVYTPDQKIAEYLSENNLKPIKPTHVTQNFKRVRLENPDYKKYVYRINHDFDKKNKIQAIIGIPHNFKKFRKIYKHKEYQEEEDYKFQKKKIST